MRLISPGLQRSGETCFRLLAAHPQPTFLSPSHHYLLSSASSELPEQCFLKHNPHTCLGVTLGPLTPGLKVEHLLFGRDVTIKGAPLPTGKILRALDSQKAFPAPHLPLLLPLVNPRPLEVLQTHSVPFQHAFSSSQPGLNSPSSVKM